MVHVLLSRSAPARDDTYDRFKSVQWESFSAGRRRAGPQDESGGIATSWDQDETEERRWTRREWTKFAIAAGIVGSITSIGATVSGQLLPPPLKFPGELREQIYYTKWPTAAWWNSRQGRPIRVTDFEEWQGATGVWRGLFLDGRWIPGTGYPVLVIRLKYDASEFRIPAELTPPEGYAFAYDDPDARIRLVALFDRCTHLCCYPGWHVIPVAYRDYRVPSPTYAVYGQDPILCICHGSQYDPLLLTTDVNPKDDAVYLGATHVHGPTQRALPVVAVRSEGGVLVGGMSDPRWYRYC